MHFTTGLVAIGSIASLATAVATPAFQFPDAVPMAKRQTSGPAYDCHASCGNAIIGSRTDGYCKNEEWLGLLKDCLDCALKYEIWQWYGGKVGPAAKACGLDATPVDPNAGGGDSTSAAPQPQTTTPSGENQSSDKPAPEPTTSAHEGGDNTQVHTDEHTEAQTSAASTPGAVETEQPAHTTSAPVPTGGHGGHGGHSNSTSSGEPPVATGAAVGMQQPVAVALGAVAVFAVNLM